MPNTQDEAQRRKLASSILASCAAKHGGVDALAKHLGVEPDAVIDWVGGKSVPPVEIVKKAVEPFLKADQ